MISVTSIGVLYTFTSDLPEEVPPKIILTFYEVKPSTNGFITQINKIIERRSSKMLFLTCIETDLILSQLSISEWFSESVVFLKGNITHIR